MILCMVLLANCKKEPFTPVFSIHEDFKSMIDTFRVESLRHGLSVDFNNLILDYNTKLEDDICGQCNSTSTGIDQLQKIVEISMNNHCWDHREELEALVFHELGHCLLGREHIMDTLPNGDPKSLMVAGNLTLYAPCKYVFGTENCNNLHKRSYYIQELFDPNTPIPSWAK